MEKNNNIRLLQNSEIDRTWWNEKLSSAANALIYCESDYLDFMCPGWNALFDAGSDAIMPLPIHRKAGIRYAFQPPFIQQLGVFSRFIPEESVINSFINEAARYAPLIDLNFNFLNQTQLGESRCNYILDLNRPFHSISKNFRKDLIRKSEVAGLIYDQSNIMEVFSLYRKMTLPKIKGLEKNGIKHFLSLARHYNETGRVICRKVVTKNNELLCAALLLRDRRRIYGLMSASTDSGRHVSANAFLLHELIKEFSDQPLIFDFQGSELPGVRFFFEKFAPEAQPYRRIQINELNYLQRKIKLLRDVLRN